MAEKKITGSFFDIQHVNLWDAMYWTDRCRFWGEANWRALVREMHGIGIDTAICGATCLWGRPMFSGYDKTVGVPLLMGCDDPLTVCVDEAEKLGMTMLFGIGLRGRCSQVRDYADMKPPWIEEWFTWNRAVSVALVEKYGGRRNFGGLYISYEIDFIDYQVELYEKLIKQYLRPAVGKVAIMASPGSLGDHPKLDDLPRHLERMDLNILAPQDYGGRRSDVPAALELVKGNAAGLEKHAKVARDLGVRWWSNCELFDFEPTPDGRAACIPGPIERIRQQIELQAPLVEKLICYQYQGIMNRKTALVDIGHPGTDALYRAYADYAGAG